MIASTSSTAASSPDSGTPSSRSRPRTAVRGLLREEGVPESGLEAAVDEVLAIMERGGE